MTTSYQILVIEDNLGDFILVEDCIIEQIENPLIEHAQSFKAAKALLNEKIDYYKVVLLDLSLPDNSGEDLIKDIINLCQNIPVVVLTGYADSAFGVKSLSMGIADYLLKEDLNSLALYKSIMYSTERKKISAALKESEKRVRNFANQLNNALEEERSHIAREIHDEFGQQLSGLKMSLSALKKQSITDLQMQHSIDSLIGDVSVSIGMVRRIANELRPVLIDKIGLFAALEWLTQTFEKKTGIRSTITIDSDPPILNKSVEINIFRICQEGLTNIAKHAQATSATIQIANMADQILITISDNGIGIATDTLKNSLSMGFLNMKERSKLIDAKLKISSALQKGTLIELIVKKNNNENINS